MSTASPVAEAAAKFHYAPGSFRNLLARFKRSPDRAFFLTNPPGPKLSSSRPDGRRRDARIVELRQKLRLSVAEIEDRLQAEGLPASSKTVLNVLRAHGFGKLSRRSPQQLEQAVRPSDAPATDRQLLDLAPRRFRTAFGGLFLFLPLLARLDLDSLLADCSLPGSAALPAGCAFRSLLALKLWGVSRHSHVMAHVFDEGLALFAASTSPPSAPPSASTAAASTPASCPRSPAAGSAPPTLSACPAASPSTSTSTPSPITATTPSTRSITCPSAAASRRACLALVVRHAEARAFCYADASVRKEDRHQAPLRFAAYWRRLTGAYPRELVFDGGFTTQAVLGEIDALGIGFLTLQRRTKKLLRALRARPPEQWRTVQLHNIGRQYRTPRVLDERARLGCYPQEIRRLAVADLGREDLVLLVTNLLQASAGKLIDRYARRMLIENQIADAIRFFHMDALSSSVPLKVDVDLQVTLMASSLYRMVAARVGRGHERARAQTLFRKFVDAVAQVVIEEERIVVRFGRRAHNPFLIKAGFGDDEQPIPWLGNKALRLVFG